MAPGHEDSILGLAQNRRIQWCAASQYLSPAFVLLSDNLA